MGLFVPEGVKVKDLLSILFLSTVAVLYFWSATGGELLLTERDLSVFFIPPRELWSEALKSGEFPLWNPYSFSGHPLFATLQPGVLYPVNLLLVFLPFDIALNWTIIVHYAMAGAFTYFLLKELRAGTAGALAGALVFMLSGYLFSVHNVMSTLFSAAWFPFALFMHIRVLRLRSFAYAIGQGFALTMMFLGGGIEALIATVFLLFLAAICPAVILVDDAGASLGRRLGLLVFAVFIFLLLSAVQLLPFLELAMQSTRANGLSFFEATTWSFDFKDFIQFFIPDPYGYGTSNDKYWSNQSWLKTVYSGAIPFVLSSFFLMKRGRSVWAFLLAAFFYLILAMGRNTPLYQVLYDYLPLVSNIRYPVKFLLVPFLFTAMAAGLGLKCLTEEAWNGKTAMRAVWALLALATLAAIALGALDFFEAGIKGYLVSNGYDYPEYNSAAINIFNAKRVLFFFIVSVIALYAGIKAKSGALIAALLITILTIDLFFAHNGYYHATPATEYHSKGPLLEFIAKDVDGPFRVFTTPKTARETSMKLTDEQRRRPGLFDFEKEKVSGYSLSHKVFDANGVEVMKRADYSLVQELIATQKGPDSTRLLSMLNVKYLISIPEIESQDWKKREFEGWSAGEGGFKIYENMAYLPRHYMVYDYRTIKRPDEYVLAFGDNSFDPGRTVLLEREPFDLQKELASGSFRVSLTGYTTNTSELEVTTEKDGILVISESWYPGWKVYVDGRQEELLKADLVLKAVALKAGKHKVSLVYSPASFKLGAAISGVGLVFAGIFLTVRLRKGERA